MLLNILKIKSLVFYILQEIFFLSFLKLLFLKLLFLKLFFINYYIYNIYQTKLFKFKKFENGDWGLGIGGWAQSPIPNPYSNIII
jgi:hypothetical protein